VSWIVAKGQGRDFLPRLFIVNQALRLARGRPHGRFMAVKQPARGTRLSGSSDHAFSSHRKYPYDPLKNAFSFFATDAIHFRQGPYSGK